MSRFTFSKLGWPRTIKCPFCHVPYDKEVSYPITGRCGHTFCATCHQAMVLDHPKNNGRWQPCPIPSCTHQASFEPMPGRNIAILELQDQLSEMEHSVAEYVSSLETEKRHRNEIGKLVSQLNELRKSSLQSEEKHRLELRQQEERHKEKLRIVIAENDPAMKNVLHGFGGWTPTQGSQGSQGSSPLNQLESLQSFTKKGHSDASTDSSVKSRQKRIVRRTVAAVPAGLDSVSSSSNSSSEKKMPATRKRTSKASEEWKNRRFKMPRVSLEGEINQASSKDYTSEEEF